MDHIYLLDVAVNNWIVDASVEVVGTENTGFYYAKLSSKGALRLDSFDLRTMPNFAPAPIPSSQVLCHFGQRKDGVARHRFANS